NPSRWPVSSRRSVATSACAASSAISTWPRSRTAAMTCTWYGTPMAAIAAFAGGASTPSRSGCRPGWNRRRAHADADRGHACRDRDTGAGASCRRRAFPRSTLRPRCGCHPPAFARRETQRMQRVDWPQLTAIAWPIVAALLLGLVVRQVLLYVAARARASSRDALPARVVQVIAVPAALALPLLFLMLAVDATPLSAHATAQAKHWLGIGVLLCATWLTVRAVGAVEARILREHPVDIEDNLTARRVQTQTRVIARVIQGAIILVGVALALMTFPAIRQIGATLLASAGIIGLVAG